MTWLLDENINRQALDLFHTAHVTVKHLAYDFHKSGIEDKQALLLATKLKKTLITADYTDFAKFPDSVILKSYGVWIFHTKDYRKQVELFKKTLKQSKLKDLKQRKSKKIIIHDDYVEIVNCKTGKKERIDF